MGRVYKRYINSDLVYACANCKTHLAAHGDIISKAFLAKRGRAYLFRSVVNSHLDEPEQRLLSTGVHTVSDIYCNVCNGKLGWKYIFASNESQRYKEGTFMIEKMQLIKLVNRHAVTANV